MENAALQSSVGAVKNFWRKLRKLDAITKKVRVSLGVGGGAKSRPEWEGAQENGLEDSKDCRSASWYGNQHVRLRGAEVSRVSL